MFAKCVSTKPQINSNLMFLYVGTLYMFKFNLLLLSSSQCAHALLCLGTWTTWLLRKTSWYSLKNKTKKTTCLGLPWTWREMVLLPLKNSQFWMLQKRLSAVLGKMAVFCNNMAEDGLPSCEKHLILLLQAYVWRFSQMPLQTQTLVVRLAAS